MSKKAGRLLEIIVEADSKDKAIEVLNETLKELYLTSDYTFLVSLEDRLSGYENNFKVLCDSYEASEKNYHIIDEIRTNCAFLYREINDELSFDVDRLKIFYENDKTARRYDAMVDMKNNGEFNANSASAARELIGGHDGYREYISLASTAYGIWKEKNGLLDSIKLFTDVLASRAKRELDIEKEDVK
jgi:hypothetical protein